MPKPIEITHPGAFYATTGQYFAYLTENNALDHVVTCRDQLVGTPSKYCPRLVMGLSGHKLPTVAAPIMNVVDVVQKYIEPGADPLKLLPGKVKYSGKSSVEVVVLHPAQFWTGCGAAISLFSLLVRYGWRIGGGSAPLLYTEGTQIADINALYAFINGHNKTSHSANVDGNYIIQAKPILDLLHEFGCQVFERPAYANQGIIAYQTKYLADSSRLKVAA